MIDMHSHILPNIDDGSQSIEESVNMLIEAKKAGFTAVVSTSHFIEEVYNTSKEERKKIIKELEERLHDENIDIEIYNAAEAYISTNLNKFIKEEKLPTINETRYLLIELPMNSEIIYLNRIIEQLKENQIIPIIAHPERYSYVQKNPKILWNLIEEGVLFQSNYGSIIGEYGKTAEKTVKKLLKNNMIHFLGTDAHRSKSIYTKMDEALKKIIKVIGEENFKLLSEVNPQKVLQNQIIYDKN